MLVHNWNWNLSTNERIGMLFTGNWIAKDPIYHIYLDDTNGRSRYGVKQYYVFAPEWAISHYEPYSQWRVGFKAWNNREALEIANNDRRVEKMCKRIWRQEFNRLICD